MIREHANMQTSTFGMIKRAQNEEVCKNFYHFFVNSYLVGSSFTDLTGKSNGSFFMPL